MYKEYTLVHDGRNLILYVKSELQSSYEKISDSFPSAKMILADYILDADTKEWIKSTESLESLAGSYLH